METIGGNIFDLSQLKKNGASEKKEQVLVLVEKAMSEILSSPAAVTGSIQANGLPETSLAALTLAKDILQLGLTHTLGISAEQFVSMQKVSLLINAVRAEMTYSNLENEAMETLAVLYGLSQYMIDFLASMKPDAPKEKLD